MIVERWVEVFITQYNIDSWARRLRGMTKVAAIFFFIPALLHVEGLPMPIVPHYRIHFISIVGREDRADPFLLALNQACQRVLWFQPAKASG
jgi:hypothetical protein